MSDTETTHTPGPWEVIFLEKEGVFVDKKGLDLEVARMSVPGEIGKANARLIAAAPELLKGVRVAKALIEKYTEEYNRIPKARGREAIVHLQNIINEATPNHS